MKRKIKKLKKEKENTNTWKVLKTYGSTLKVLRA